MRTIRFGIIGCGLMGREFASAAARWCHLTQLKAKPQIVAICNRSAGPMQWFCENIPTIKQVTHDYRELLANDKVDAVYIAVPHHLHQEMYIAAVEAGKHLFGEKPFGIDLKANLAINDAIQKNPHVFVRCCSEFPFFPAVQRIGAMIEKGAFGRVFEVNSHLLHSSDLDPDKVINWKRVVQFNGAYGCMGDLGMHALHLPFRAGWLPINVRAILSDIIKQRPDAGGSMVPCETWDNATLLCEAQETGGQRFPLTIKTHRISPGQRNSWEIEILGTQSSVRFSTANPRKLELLQYSGKEQVWQSVQTGYESTFKTITGPIFEFGFTDAILQMWASFVHELTTQSTPSRFAGCATPYEAAVSHRLFTAALASHKNKAVVECQ